MRVPLLIAALPLVSALPRSLLDKRTTDTDPTRGRVAGVNWNGTNDYSSLQGKDRDPSWQGKDRDPSWQGKDRDPSWQGKDRDPSWQGKDSDPSWQGEDNHPSWNGPESPDWPEDPSFPDFPEDNSRPQDFPPEDDDLTEDNGPPKDNNLTEDNDLPEDKDDYPPKDDGLPEDNDLPDNNNLTEDKDEDYCPPEDDESPNPGDNTPPKPSTTTTSASDKPVATQTEPVVSATPSPTEVASGTDKALYMPVVDKWLAELKLRPLKYDAELAKTALQCSELSNGDLIHRGKNAQIMAPGEEKEFERVFVGGWLGERPDLFPDQEVWRNFSREWNYQGQTGHADSLADQATYTDGTPLKLTKIGCGWAQGSKGGEQWYMWTCDLA